MFFVIGDTESTDMTDEDDASSSSKLTKNNEGTTTAYEECKGVLKILNGDDQQQEQEYIESKLTTENYDIKDEFDDEDEVDLNEDKLNGDENDELDQDSMLMLNGK